MADDEREDLLLTDEVRQLLALIKDTDIAEVLIERGDAKLHVKRALPQPIIAPPSPTYAVPPQPIYAAPQPAVAAAAASSSAGAAPADVEPVVPGETITAPMVGTYYASPAPKEPPYVQVGDEVKPGDVLGIIEAMKIMNEIECELHGRVVQLMVENAEPVEYGQPLMVIEPL